ncbi:YdeI/OmpD-associated family protein [Cerasicoccus arenae]|uniref:DUF1905 domain-containing protein n=1 Tax=Cerasicoccus arenae TaxID=424488 RepID=A0A8J3GDU0_9BACT|nr:YdeI/OmpD-associated family protein [Cerasicoccus arenae]GHC04695.1 hypothetical protein GCM10007047_21830 [Cerasicoccus arenae]
MAKKNQIHKFEAALLRPAKTGDNDSWAFVVLPKKISENLPRRGRTTVEGKIHGHPFQATLEPDGQLSHWLKIDENLQKAACLDIGEIVTFEIFSMEKEPEPEVPLDLQEALSTVPEAHKVWNKTTTIARIDWIHWIESAKQSRTRTKRINDACAMLSEGKKRVCCFDPSGYYSKAFKAPEAAVVVTQ